MTSLIVSLQTQKGEYQNRYSNGEIACDGDPEDRRRPEPSIWIAAEWKALC
jgi:hypothetical protein